MPRLEEKEVNESRSVLLSYTDNELHGDIMFEIRWSNEKRDGTKPVKCAQRRDEERT